MGSFLFDTRFVLSFLYRSTIYFLKWRVFNIGAWRERLFRIPELLRRGIAPIGMKSMGGEGDMVKKKAVTAQEALAYAMQFARDLDPQLADRFVGMYVNERTLDYGEDGKEAIRRLLEMGYRAGIIAVAPRVEFAE